MAPIFGVKAAQCVLVMVIVLEADSHNVEQNYKWMYVVNMLDLPPALLPWLPRYSCSSEFLLLLLLLLKWRGGGGG